MPKNPKREQEEEVGGLLGRYSDVMLEFGVGSPEADAFLQEHASNEQFIYLAPVAVLLRKAFPATKLQ